MLLALTKRIVALLHHTPVEDSTTITDHFITDNDKFKISGVVSDFDFLNPLNQIAFGVEGYEDNSVANQSLIRFKNGELINGTGVIPLTKHKTLSRTG